VNVKAVKPSESSLLARQPSAKALFIEVSDMKAEYDLSKLKARKNPYASKLKKPVTMRLSEDVVVYFKSMADDAGVPYQSLINLYLRDCLANNRKVQINWPKLA
jgi:uncharacterized protein (DUF4415 family)